MKPLQMLPIAALVGSIFGNPVLAADEAATETTPVKAEIKAVRVKGQRNAPRLWNASTLTVSNKK